MNDPITEQEFMEVWDHWCGLFPPYHRKPEAYFLELKNRITSEELQYARAWIWNAPQDTKGAKPHFPDIPDIIALVAQRRLKLRHPDRAKDYRPIEELTPEEIRDAIANLKRLRRRQVELIQNAPNDTARKCHEIVLRIMGSSLDRLLAHQHGLGPIEREANAKPANFATALGIQKGERNAQ